MCPCVWSASPDAIVEVSFILTWTLTLSLHFEFCVNWDLTDVTNTWLSKRFVTKYLWLILILVPALPVQTAGGRGTLSQSWPGSSRWRIISAPVEDALIWLHYYIWGMQTGGAVILSAPKFDNLQEKSWETENWKTSQSRRMFPVCFTLS